eukprot:6198178-Pleurochrysis_carterae.AAC.1
MRAQPRRELTRARSRFALVRMHAFKSVGEEVGARASVRGSGQARATYVSERANLYVGVNIARVCKQRGALAHRGACSHASIAHGRQRKKRLLRAEAGGHPLRDTEQNRSHDMQAEGHCRPRRRGELRANATPVRARVASVCFTVAARGSLYLKKAGKEIW